MHAGSPPGVSGQHVPGRGASGGGGGDGGMGTVIPPVQPMPVNNMVLPGAAAPYSGVGIAHTAGGVPSAKVGAADSGGGGGRNERVRAPTAPDTTSGDNAAGGSDNANDNVNNMAAAGMPSRMEGSASHGAVLSMPPSLQQQQHPPSVQQHPQHQAYVPGAPFGCWYPPSPGMLAMHHPHHAPHAMAAMMGASPPQHLTMPTGGNSSPWGSPHALHPAAYSQPFDTNDNGGGGGGVGSRAANRQGDTPSPYCPSRFEAGRQGPCTRNPTAGGGELVV
jgi:hypothetical protein